MTEKMGKLLFAVPVIVLLGSPQNILKWRVESIRDDMPAIYDALLRSIDDLGLGSVSVTPCRASEAESCDQCPGER